MPYTPPHIEETHQAELVHVISTANCKLGGKYMDQTQSSRVQNHSPLKLYVRVLHAKGLLAEDFTGTSDPFVIVRCGEVAVSTEVVKNTLDPTWNEQVSLGILPHHLDASPIHIEVHDKDRGRRDELLGTTNVSFCDVPATKPKRFDLELDTQGKLSLAIWVAGPGARSGAAVEKDDEEHAQAHPHHAHHGAAPHTGHHKTHAELEAEHALHKPVLHEILPDGSLIHLRSAVTGKNLRLKPDLSIDARGGKGDYAVFEIYHEGNGFLLRSFGDESNWLAIDGDEVVAEEEDWSTIFEVLGHFGDQDTVGLHSEYGDWLAVAEDGSCFGKKNEDNKLHDDIQFTIEHAEE